MMNRLLILGICFLCVVGLTAWKHGSSGAALGWHLGGLPGPGGQVTSLDIQCDQGVGNCSPGVGTVTKVIRTDVFNGYIWQAGSTNCTSAVTPAGCWVGLVTPATMPGGTAAGVGFAGVYEVVIAPSNTQHLYLIWGSDGCFYHSTTHGASWVKSSGNAPGGTCLPGNGSGSNTYNPNTGALNTKMFHPFIAVDPVNENIVYSSTPTGGAYVSTNGGDTWTVISTLGTGGLVGGSQGGGTLYAFDSSNGAPGGTTNNIFACTYGTGVFQTTNGGSTWSALNTAGMPTTCRSMAVENGVLWVLDNSSKHNINTWVNGTGWNNFSTVTTSQNNWWGISFDKNNCASDAACHVLVVDDGGGTVLNNNGSGGTFSVRSAPNTVAAPPNGIVATDIPWLVQNGTAYQSVANIAYNPTISNQAEWSAGTGYFYITPSTSNFIVNSQSTGIMELVSNNAISPPGGSVILAFDDRAFFKIINPDIPPSTDFPVSFAPGWDIAYVEGTPSFLAGLAYQAGNASGFSTDGGTTWNLFSSLPDEMNPISAQGGQIAAISTQNILVSLSNNGDMYLTTNQGSSWSQVLISGVPAGAGNLPTTGVAGNVYSFTSVPSQIATGIGAGWTYRLFDITRCSGASMAVSSATVNSVTVTSNTCGAATAGDIIWLVAQGVGNGPGWGSASFINAHRMCADAGGTYYAYNDGPNPGIYTSSDGGNTWSLGWSGTFQFSSAAQPAKLHCLPGVANQLYGTSGVANNTTAFYNCTNASGTITCTTWTVAHGFAHTLTGVRAVGFGQAKPGGSGTPSIYIRGVVDSGSLDVYRSYDGGASWTALNVPGTFDGFNVVTGDANDYKGVYACFRTSSCIYGRFN